MIDTARIMELLEKVPQPPEEPIPVGVSDKECDDFEIRTGITLPAGLRSWLKVSNGPCVGPGGLYGIRPQRSYLDIESHLAMYPCWISKKWIPVAGDGCGNEYIVPTRGEYGDGFPVLFVETSYSTDVPSFIAASDFGHFLVLLLEEELQKTGWPFDMQRLLNMDPQITKFSGVPFPWEV